MKNKDEEIQAILSSMVRGEEHIVSLKIDTILSGPLAVQYKLLRLMKGTTNEKKFIDALILIGVSQVSKTFLHNIINTKILNMSLFNELFKKDDYLNEELFDE